MSAGALPLPAFQSWMQSVLVHPGGVEAGVRSLHARRLVPPGRLSAVVRAQGALDPVERLGIYASMYPLRITEALRSDGPALAALLGERRYGELVHDYVAAHPSRSFTLARLGEKLPDFLAAWGSPRGRALRVDVARLERAAAVVFDADEVPPLEAGALAGVLAEHGEALRLISAPAFAILEARPGAIAVLDAVLDERKVPTAAGRGRVHVAFYRRDFNVLRRTLGPVAGRLLTALAEGASLGEALDRASRGGRRPAPKRVAGWLAEWCELGFFAAAAAAAGAESRASR